MGKIFFEGKSPRFKTTARVCQVKRNQVLKSSLYEEFDYFFLKKIEEGSTCEYFTKQKQGVFCCVAM